jgi:hypothetical protein
VTVSYTWKIYNYSGEDKSDTVSERKDSYWVRGQEENVAQVQATQTGKVSAEHLGTVIGQPEKT